MLRKYTALMLIGLIINLAFGSFVFGQNGEAGAAEKIKAKVADLGAGGKLIEVKLKDKTKIKGYIAAISDDRFVFVSKKTDVSADISYDRVKSIRRTEFSAVQKIAIGTAAAVGALFLIVGICYGAGACPD